MQLIKARVSYTRDKINGNVTCMLHMVKTCIDLGTCHTQVPFISTSYSMQVSCDMHGFWVFSMHVAYVKQFKIKVRFLKC